MCSPSNWCKYPIYNIKRRDTGKNLAQSGASADPSWQSGASADPRWPKSCRTLPRDLLFHFRILPGDVLRSRPADRPTTRPTNRPTTTETNDDEQQRRTRTTDRPTDEMTDWCSFSAFHIASFSDPPCVKSTPQQVRVCWGPLRSQTHMLGLANLN